MNFLRKRLDILKKPFEKGQKLEKFAPAINAFDTFLFVPNHTTKKGAHIRDADAQHYRTKEEVEEYRKIDPISQVKEIILSKKYASQDDLDKVDESVKARVLECEKFAESSPYPDLDLMYNAVYEQEDYPFIKHKL